MVKTKTLLDIINLTLKLYELIVINGIDGHEEMSTFVQKSYLYNEKFLICRIAC